MGVENSVGGTPRMSYFTSLTEYSISDLEGVGTVRIDQYGRKFRWMKNASDNAARLGGTACFDATLIAASTFFQRATTEDLASADIPFFAGLWMSVVPGGYYGWVITEGTYDTAKVGMNSAGTALAIGGLMVPNASTDIAGTGTAVCYALVDGEVLTTYGAETTLSVSTIQKAARRPHCVLLDACATGTSTTPGLTLSVFVKGML